MIETRKLSRTVALAAGSLLVVAAGVLANLLLTKSEAGIVGSIAGILAIVAVSVIIVWRLGANDIESTANEYEALRRVQLVLSTARNKLIHWNVDFDLPLSIELRHEGREFSAIDMQTRSAFIASLTSDPRCTIIVGAPGAGKSTLLTQLSLQMIDGRLTDKFHYVPLMLQCRDWDSDIHLSSWVINQTRLTYGINTNITRRWLNRGSAILILDGLDEIPATARRSFVPQLNGWLRSAVGGRAIVSCRSDSYFESFRDIIHEQVATLEPLPYAEILQYLSKILDQKVIDDRVRHDVQSLLSHAISPGAELSSMWSTPLLVRLLADGVIDLSLGSHMLSQTTEASDPAAIALELGDRLREQGNETGAIESYMAAVNSPGSQWRSIAGVRASLLLARSGDYDRAQKALNSTLAKEIERSLREPPASLSNSLSEDERAVLKVVSPDKTLDVFQVSSLSSVPLSRCNDALRSLRDRGLVEVADKEKGEPRFRRSSSFELVDQ
jgi:NACHT domain